MYPALDAGFFVFALKETGLSAGRGDKRSLTTE
jgi:hypothetical protein